MNYLYVLKYNIEEAGMCAMEMRRVFHQDSTKKYFITEQKEDVTRSLFTKSRLDILLETDDFQELLEKIEAQKYDYQNYKTIYVQVEGYEKTYEERCVLNREVGCMIELPCAMSDPDIWLGYTEIEGKWYFGELHKNTQDWHKHDDMPYHFSTALPMRQARTVVNIAVGDDPSKRLVDPCCGIGTVLLEACGLGFKIDGFDIHYPVKEGARKNVEYYRYDAVVKRMDMRDITEHYDTAIIDIPYGLYTAIEEKEQQEILDHARHICDELVLVSNRDMCVEMEKAGFEVVDQTTVTKARFVRYIMIGK
ncbi:MAG: hypothetical protein E7191_08810 [Erysipelotrichaceae bacterium]|nr:hypothetical protein [Erysipelotrichaceae bacterium]